MQIVVAAKSFGRAEPEGAEMLKRAGFSLSYLPEKGSAHDELAGMMRDERTVAVVAGAEAITGEMIQNSPNLRVIAMHGVGLSHIDCESASRRGIQVKAIPGGNAQAVADLTWALILAVSRHICEADSAVRRGDWSGRFIGFGLDHKTIGIIGFGAIGQAVAKRATAFDMMVLAHDIISYPEAARAVGATFTNLDSLLCSSDIITVHVPFGDGTRNLIGEAEFGRMKHTCVLVNTSRGGVVDEKALCKYLKEGLIGGAGVDVFAEEPLPPTHCLVSAPNCVLTPHIGARTRETIRFMGLETARNILSVLTPLSSGTRP